MCICGRDGLMAFHTHAPTRKLIDQQQAVAKNMERTLDVPIFRVSRTIVTDKFDALYKVLNVWVGVGVRCGGFGCTRSTDSVDFGWALPVFDRLT